MSQRYWQIGHRVLNSLPRLSESAEVLPGLDLVICGTAVGSRSAAQKTYADARKRFWAILAETGLTPRRLPPGECKRLLEFGIGLTDLAKRHSGTDGGLVAADFGVAAFSERIARAHPRVLAFNGKKAASSYFGAPTAKIDYGPQRARIGATLVFVLTQTSGSNGHWRPQPWHACAQAVRNVRAQQ